MERKTLAGFWEKLIARDERAMIEKIVATSGFDILNRVSNLKYLRAISNSRPLIMNKSIAISLSLILVVAVVITFGVFRQNAVNAATRQWERAGGGISDTEIPLLGPAEVFLNLDGSEGHERLHELNLACRELCRVCSPIIDLRVVNEDGRSEIIGDEHLGLFEAILRRTDVKSVYLFNSRFTVNPMVDFLKNTSSIKRLTISDCFTESEINEINRMVGRDVLR